MKIGFTGTQRGMTAAQKQALRSLLEDDVSELHHGDCIGADAEAHDIAAALGVKPVIHPPSNPVKRAFKAARRLEPRRSYLSRNRAIVRATDALIAAPGEPDEQIRSGTWSTVRFARRLGRRVNIILPDGSCQT